MTTRCLNLPPRLRPEGHNAACAIWAKPNSITVNDAIITKAPLHGTLALRGRTGVIYRPADQSGGEDFFAFALRGTQDTRDQVCLFRAHVTINQRASGAARCPRCAHRLGSRRSVNARKPEAGDGPQPHAAGSLTLLH